MGDNYFSYWVARHGRNAFINLVNKVCKKVKVPEKVEEQLKKEEYLIQYFYMVYYIVTLDHFGLDAKHIYFILDFLHLGAYQEFSPEEILKVQKDAIPDILYYVEKDLEKYRV